MIIMKHFFQRTLPKDNDGNWLNEALIAGVIVFFILFFFRPFGLGQYTDIGFVFSISLAYVAFSFMATLAYVAFSFMATLAYGWVVYKPWMRHVRQWRVWKECVAIMLLLCLISLGNAFLDTLLFGRSLTLMRFLAWTYATFVVSIPVTIVIVALDNFDEALKLNPGNKMARMLQQRFMQGMQQ
jgi:hypothetical protein